MTNRAGIFSGPVGMLFSAAIFGFFGFFYLNWNTPGVNGQVVPFRVLLGWTLKISSILFFVSAGVTLAQPVLGNLLYALVGVIGAGLFIIVAVMDLADPQHMIMPYAPFVLVLFAAWNGYGSWTSLRAVLAVRAERESFP